MGRRLGSYSIALFYFPTAWRVVALCAVALALIPISLAQSFQLIMPTFNPSDGWNVIYPEGMASEASSDNYYVQFFADSNTWSSLMISVAVREKNHNTDGEATLFEDGLAVLTFGQQGGVLYEIPAGGNRIYNYTIRAKPGSPDSVVSVYQIIASKEVSLGGTQVMPTPNLSLSGTQSPSNQSGIATTTVIPSSASLTSSTTQPTSLTNIPTTLSPTIPTGLLSAPAYTNPPVSISNTSPVSSGSNSSGPSSSTIIGAVFGVLAGIILCIFATLVYRRRRVRNRVAPSTAFMNYRSTTEQPPAYPFTRTSFFRRSKAGLAGFGGAGDHKTPSPHGVNARDRGSRLMTLDEKSAEGRDLLMTPSVIAPSHEDPQRLFVPYQGTGSMGAGGSDTRGGSLGAGAPGPVGSRGLGIDGIARTLAPLPNTTSDKFASTPSSSDQNPYDGLAMPELAVNSHADPFRTPPAHDSNLAGRGAWGRA